jgi:6-phosphogluconolactonase
MKRAVHIFKDPEALSRAAAEIFVTLAAQAIAERGRFLVALNGGGTPKPLFHLLAADFRDKIDWIKTHVFWGDERCVPPDDPESSYGLARTILLDRVPIPADNVHRILSDTSTSLSTSLGPGEASTDYALTLKRFASPPLDWPRFDLVLLGMGDDGHTASLFPGSPVDATEPVIPVTAHYQDRPANRVTLTPLVFNSAWNVVFLVAGASKAEALSRVLNGEFLPERYPAQRIQPTDGTLTWMVDEAAGSALTPSPSPDYGRGGK